MILLMHGVTMILLMHGVTMILLMHGVTMILLMHGVTMKFNIIFVQIPKTSVFNNILTRQEFSYNFSLIFLTLTILCYKITDCACIFVSVCPSVCIRVTARDVVKNFVCKFTSQKCHVCSKGHFRNVIYVSHQ